MLGNPADPTHKLANFLLDSLQLLVGEVLRHTCAGRLEEIRCPPPNGRSGLQERVDPSLLPLVRESPRDRLWDRYVLVLVSNRLIIRAHAGAYFHYYVRHCDHTRLHDATSVGPGPRAVALARVLLLRAIYVLRARQSTRARSLERSACAPASVRPRSSALARQMTHPRLASTCRGPICQTGPAFPCRPPRGRGLCPLRSRARSTHEGAHLPGHHRLRSLPSKIMNFPLYTQAAVQHTSPSCMAPTAEFFLRFVAWTVAGALSFFLLRLLAVPC